MNKTDTEAMNVMSHYIIKNYGTDGIPTEGSAAEWVIAASDWMLAQGNLDYRWKLISPKVLKASAMAAAMSVVVCKQLGWIR